MKTETLMKILKDAGEEFEENATKTSLEWYGKSYLFMQLNGKMALCNRIEIRDIEPNWHIHKKWTQISFQKDYYTFFQGDIGFVKTLKVME